MQATGKIVYLFSLNKAGVVEDIAVLNPVNNPVVEEAALAWKKSCKYPVDMNWRSGKMMPRLSLQ